MPWCKLLRSPLRMLVTFWPGHIDGLFRAVAEGRNVDLAVVVKKFGVRIVGPALLEGFYTISSHP
jgi:hypothetical protein